MYRTLTILQCGSDYIYTVSTLGGTKRFSYISCSSPKKVFHLAPTDLTGDKHTQGNLPFEFHVMPGRFIVESRGEFEGCCESTIWTASRKPFGRHTESIFLSLTISFRTRLNDIEDGPGEEI